MDDNSDISTIGILFRASSLLCAVGVILYLSTKTISATADPPPIYEGYEILWPISNAEERTFDTVSLPLSLPLEPHLGTVTTRLDIVLRSDDPLDLTQFRRARETRGIGVEEVVHCLVAHEFSTGTGIVEDIGIYTFGVDQPGVSYVLGVGSPDKRVILTALKQILDEMVPAAPCVDFHVGLKSDFEETLSTYFSFDRGNFRYEIHLYRLPLSSRYKSDIRAPADYFGMVLVVTDNRTGYPYKWSGMGIKPVDRRPAIEFWQLPENFDCL